MGNISGATVPHLKVDVFSKTIDTNVKGTSKYRDSSNRCHLNNILRVYTDLIIVLCVRAVSEVMSKQDPLTYTSRRHGERSLGRGSIVNLGSLNSYISVPGMLPYTTSKHAVIGLTKSAGKSYLPFY